MAPRYTARLVEIVRASPLLPRAVEEYRRRVAAKGIAERWPRVRFVD